MICVIFALVVAALAGEPAPLPIPLQPAGTEVYNEDNPRERAIIQWADTGLIQGSNRNSVDLFFFVIASDGGCAEDSNIYMSVSAGEIVKIHSWGCGLYSVRFVPPTVKQHTEVIFTISGLTDAREAIWNQQGVWIEPLFRPLTRRKPERGQKLHRESNLFAPAD